MAFRWYVVHTYSGFENKVKVSLQERIEAAGMQDFFADVLVPEEDIVELVSGEKKTSKRKFFPGYVLVKMELNDDTWHIVKNTPKVTGFIGTKDKPTPIPDEDVTALRRLVGIVVGHWVAARDLPPLARAGQRGAARPSPRRIASMCRRHPTSKERRSIRPPIRAVGPRRRHGSERRL